MGTAASTANLLDDVEGHAYGKECCARLCCAWHGLPHITPGLAQVWMPGRNTLVGPKPPSSVVVESPQVPLGILSLSKETLPWAKLGCLPLGLLPGAGSVVQRCPGVEVAQPASAFQMKISKHGGSSSGRRRRRHRRKGSKR